MPIENTKPPDPLISEFCELTGMDPLNIRLAGANDSFPKGKEGKAKRHRHGIKVKISTPGSASAGADARLKSLRSSKVFGKPRKRVDSSPIDNRGGKRVICASAEDEIGKVLNDLRSGAIDTNLKFALGSNCDKNASVKSADFHDETNSNDGSFINLPIDKTPLDNYQMNPVAKSEGLEPGSGCTSKGVGRNTSCTQTGSKDSCAMAKTGKDVEMTGLDPRSEQTDMEDVVKNGEQAPSDLNGIVKDKIGNGFEFGRKDNDKGILNKPIGPLFTVQFGKNGINNPFVKNTVSQKDNAWNSSGIKGFGNTVIANQFIVNADRFAEKLKQGKLDFARVLVEVAPLEELPSILEIEYPPIGNRPAKVGKLDVKYQWKPPLCTHCKTFGHTTMACKVRPMTQEEIDAKAVKMKEMEDKEALKNSNKNGQESDGFIQVGKNNKPVNNIPKNVDGAQNRNVQQDTRQDKFQKRTVNKQYVATQSNGKGVNYMKKNAKNVTDPLPLQQLSKDPNFKPKILVRGSGSKTSFEAVVHESVPISNSFQGLTDVDMGEVNDKEEFYSKVWPNLKEDVDILFEAGIYPSQAIRVEWTSHQLDYFYRNCHKYQLDPSYEDDDVDSDTEGIAKDMKLEFVECAAGNKSNDAANLSSVLNEHVLGNWDWISNNANSMGGTRIIVGWDPYHIKLMVMEQDAQVVHCIIESLNGDLRSHCSFVYASTNIVERRNLWKSLCKYCNTIKGSPWVILGDFNATLDPSEKSTGSGSKTSSEAVVHESVPISNSFQGLTDVDMGEVNDKEEFYSKVWPNLKEDVDILFEAGIYPSQAIRVEWTSHQLDYFYRNCHKYQLDHSYEDDDVDSDTEGIAKDMKPEFVECAAGNKSNDAANLSSVLNECMVRRKSSSMMEDSNQVMYSSMFSSRVSEVVIWFGGGSFLMEEGNDNVKCRCSIMVVLCVVFYYNEWTSYLVYLGCISFMVYLGSVALGYLGFVGELDVEIVGFIFKVREWWFIFISWTYGAPFVRFYMLWAYYIPSFDGFTGVKSSMDSSLYSSLMKCNGLLLFWAFESKLSVMSEDLYKCYGYQWFEDMKAKVTLQDIKMKQEKTKEHQEYRGFGGGTSKERGRCDVYVGGGGVAGLWLKSGRFLGVGLV
ncbi:RNA-directed DNA polymerase, eukaryota, Reverse transcriptase zinc-binding domain protein [Artemisia annua]|uniref:RNA-directed DNA polymerase, eukaryota, Reverse transcriptase zinc-binding domain protein n=1 Tax=Artemisia annua TaxID=35608 RepID=A0A2U1NCS7_ARTAN|nr:RNA-directed DNA polymerase, eukaryota, Reverse transcriptase zinc-binding domain protein [Artemisia annua]